MTRPYEPTLELSEQLQRSYPNGHPAFVPITVAEIELHDRKNHDYAKGGDPLGNFKRVAAILALYPDLKLSDPRVVLLVYTLKQVDAILWGLSQNITALVEGLEPRAQDISVYIKILQCLEQDRKDATV